MKDCGFLSVLRAVAALSVPLGAHSSQLIVLGLFILLGGQMSSPQIWPERMPLSLDPTSSK